MNKFINKKDSSFEENKDQDSVKNNKKEKKLEKILCNHCGRTTSNGIRCMGICVADNDY
tara:strand:- start:5658 stop:5834 length:177 start_codon:yes stop_codon:yes gene_type:complete